MDPQFSFLTTFGLPPYFKKLLLAELQEALFLVFSFYKSLSQELQQEQMDLIVKYFKEDKVAYRYLTSAFLGYTQAEDLKKKFEEGTQDLKMKKMVQLSMDGPNVNLILYKSITKERNEIEDYLALIDAESCSLHVVHGTFQNGVQKTKWSIDGVLKSMHNMFDDAQAKRKHNNLIGLDTFS